MSLRTAFEAVHRALEAARIEFANTLRGVAAMSVICAHLGKPHAVIRTAPFTPATARGDSDDDQRRNGALCTLNRHFRLPAEATIFSEEITAELGASSIDPMAERESDW